MKNLCFILILLANSVFSQQASLETLEYKNLSHKIKPQNASEWISYAYKNKYLLFAFTPDDNFKNSITLNIYSLKNDELHSFQQVAPNSIQHNKNFISFIDKKNDTNTLNVFQYKDAEIYEYELSRDEIKNYSVLGRNNNKPNLFAIIHYKSEKKGNLESINLLSKESKKFDEAVLEYRCFDDFRVVVRYKKNEKYFIASGDASNIGRKVLMNDYFKISRFNEHSPSNHVNIAIFGQKHADSEIKIFYCHNIFSCLIIADNKNLIAGQNYALNEQVQLKTDKYWYRLYFDLKTESDKSYLSYVFPNALFRRAVKLEDDDFDEITIPPYIFSNYILGSKKDGFGKYETAYIISFTNGVKEMISETISANKYYITQDGNYEYWLNTQNNSFDFFSNEKKQLYSTPIPSTDEKTGKASKVYDISLPNKKKYHFLLSVDATFYLVDTPVKISKNKTYIPTIQNLTTDNDLEFLEQFTSKNLTLFFKKETNSETLIYAGEAGSNFGLKKEMNFPKETTTWTYSPEKKEFACILFRKGKVLVFKGKKRFSKMTKIYPSQ